MSYHRRQQLAKFEIFVQNNGTPLSIYHELSSKPITPEAEVDMETLSSMASGDADSTSQERLLSEWRQGDFNCSRCSTSHPPLFSSQDKWKGPCTWASFRRTATVDSCEAIVVENYNNYECEVCEVYCRRCSLFVGHRFEDGRTKGDLHENARYRF